jgi:hypothetical protein
MTLNEFLNSSPKEITRVLHGANGEFQLEWKEASPGR